MINLMKKGIVLITILSYLCFFNVSLATNTYSINLVKTSSQYLNNTLATFLADNVTDATIECWIKTASQPATNTSNQVFALVTSANGNAGFLSIIRYADVSGTKKLRAYFGGSGATWAEYEITLSTDTWYHLAIVKDSTVVTLYVTASSVGSAGASGTARDWSTASTGLRLGSGRDVIPSRFWDGKIDDFRIWSDVRTPTEISDNYEQELVGNEAGLVGYWKLNNSLLDETSNDNDLTNNNSATFSSDVPFVGAVRRIIMVE